MWNVRDLLIFVLTTVINTIKLEGSLTVHVPHEIM